MMFNTRIVIALLLIMSSAAHPQQSETPQLEQVARFEHQVTGVTVAIPFPNEEWNAWRNAKTDEVDPKNHSP